MIIITGGAGFIGANIVKELNKSGITNILVVDNLSSSLKWKNLNGLLFSNYIHKDAFINQLLQGSHPSDVESIIHMGACSSTTETDVDYLWENNVEYSKVLATWAIEKNIRFIYASSAATYGDGELGFSDEVSDLNQWRPLNPYGWSKQQFDLWLDKNDLFEKVVGLKFFNVFGPYEWHKGNMMSMICKAKTQIDETGKVKLFRSHKSEYEDGGQLRDFIYVKDCAKIICWLLKNNQVNGLFNCGFGKARSWNDLANAVFKSLNKPPNIEYIDMPDSIRNQYQYFTESTMNKMKKVGAPLPEYSLEAAVNDYIQHYL
ncbi:MAG: ADP-glyceromanno-heptose 6-epimerase [Candidatus Margulisiibacteriota bacterium]